MSAQPSVPSNVILIGKKPPMAYATAMIVMPEKEIIVKARGRAISTAVSAVEIFRRLTKANVKEIKIGSEQIGQEPAKRTVSTIEIVLVKEA